MVNHETGKSQITQLTPVIKNLFKNPPTFVQGVEHAQQLKQFPFAEIAFWGRSNVGKSSLINALVGAAIARTSKTPGRTQQLNLFNLGDKLIIVDMPGYGFAQVPLKIRKNWEVLISDYLQQRDQLKRVFLLVDAQHGLKNSDLEVIDFLEQVGIPYQIVLTKADRITNAAKNSIKDNLNALLALRSKALKDILITSTTKTEGIFELKKEIAIAISER